MNTFINTNTIKLAVTPAQRDMLTFVSKHRRYFGYTGELSTKSTRATFNNALEMREALVILGESNRCVANKLIALIDDAVAPLVREYYTNNTKTKLQQLVDDIDCELRAKDVITKDPVIEAALSTDTLVALYK